MFVLKEITSDGFQAVGAGTRTRMTLFGGLASGGMFRRDANGFQAIGHRLKAATDISQVFGLNGFDLKLCIFRLRQNLCRQPPVHLPCHLRVSGSRAIRSGFTAVTPGRRVIGWSKGLIWSGSPHTMRGLQEVTFLSGATRTMS